MKRWEQGLAALAATAALTVGTMACSGDSKGSAGVVEFTAQGAAPITIDLSGGALNPEQICRNVITMVLTERAAQTGLQPFPEGYEMSDGDDHQTAHLYCKADLDKDSSPVERYEVWLNFTRTKYSNYEPGDNNTGDQSVFDLASISVNQRDIKDNFWVGDPVTFPNPESLYVDICRGLEKPQDYIVDHPNPEPLALVAQSGGNYGSIQMYCVG